MRTLTILLCIVSGLVVVGCQSQTPSEPLPAEKVVAEPAQAPINADGSDPR